MINNFKSLIYIKNLETFNRIFLGEYKIYIFGTNKWALDLFKKIDIQIDGFINELTDLNEIDGVKIIKNLNQISANNSIVICSILSNPWLIKQKLDSYKIENIDYFAFWSLSNYKLIDERNWLGFKSNFKEENYIKISNELADIESKFVLENIINFRLSLDISFLKFFSDKQYYQYFENFLELESESFIDIGCFDGHTSKYFLNHIKTNSIIFEPDKSNFEQCKINLSDFKDNIEYYNFGLGNKEEILKFKSNGSTSVVSDEGDISIQIKILDNIFNKFPENQTFYLKMDIEGWELNALKGAENFIKKNKPKMAICVYHKPNDIEDIFNYVKSLNPNYKVYLRHYTGGVDETVMYFV